MYDPMFHPNQLPLQPQLPLFRELLQSLPHGYNLGGSRNERSLFSNGGDEVEHGSRQLSENGVLELSEEVKPFGTGKGRGRSGNKGTKCTDEQSLQLSKLQLDTASNVTSCLDDHGEVHLSAEDKSSWYGSDDQVNEASDMDKEWQRRHDQFYTMGYRDGLIAGKEASSQEGFNIGFKQSVLVGYNWGLVRGVTSALASLPDGIREKLIETEEQRTRFQVLYKSVHSLSTTDALRLFNDEITSKRAGKQIASSETSSSEVETGLGEQRSDHIDLGNYSAELLSLLLESPGIKVKMP